MGTVRRFLSHLSKNQKSGLYLLGGFCSFVLGTAGALWLFPTMGLINGFLLLTGGILFGEGLVRRTKAQETSVR